MGRLRGELVTRDIFVTADKPLVSFVLPSYNCLEWIGESLVSLLGQSEKNIEIIVVDDGSTDGTKEFLAEWPKDERVRVITNEKNLGAGPSRHLGAELAKADIICICDSDDVYDSDRAKVTLEWFEKNPDSELVTFPYVSIGYNNELIETFPGESFDHDLFKEKGKVTYFCNPSTAMKKKSYFETEGYKKETDKQTDDFAMVSNWVKSGKKIDFCPSEYVTMHRNRPESMMSGMRGFDPAWVSK